MMRFMLILGAGLLTGNVAHAAAGDAACPNGSDIKGKVYALNDYDPVPTTNSPSDIPDPQGAANDSEKGRIQTAFNLASSGLQKDLCDLAYIFVGKGNVKESWGKWANPQYSPDPSKKNKAVIVVHSNDLNKSLKNRLDDTFAALNINTKTTAKHNEIIPNGYTGSPSEDLLLLYVIAHEMAHIKWRRDYNSFTNGSCTDLQTFMSKSWSDSSNWNTYVTGSQYRWTKLGDTFGGRDIGINPHAVPKPVDKNRTLFTIYQSNVLTALGAANPEEDFVETYALQAFMKAAPQFQIQVIIDPQALSPTKIIVNDPARGDDPDIEKEINDKFKCVQSLL